MRTGKRIMELALSVLLCVFLLPAAAEASESEPVLPEHCVLSSWDGPTNNERYEMYLRGLFYEELSRNSPSSLEEKLGPINYALEQQLKTQIEAVARGDATSTCFAVPCTNEEVSQLDLDLLYDGLLADCTASLYWHDMRLGIGAEWDGSTLYLSFAVAADYRGDEYEVDPARIKAARTAKENADAIIAAYASASDTEKLRGYMKEICSRNVYNSAAAAGGSGTDVGINPWQLVYVFDNDPSTNVVCEGYSKAFEYLCDNTDFASSRINCICVSGDDHMWNVVRMDDGYNYAVDVTWSEAEGSSEYTNYAMFLSYAVGGSLQSGYTLSYGNNGSRRGHTYYDDMFTIYTDEELTISDLPYGQRHISESRFPDENFRSYISQNLDTDGSGILEETEIAAVTQLHLSGLSISDLQGLEIFSALTELDCSDNDLTALDVSGLPHLTELDCSDNPLTELEIADVPALAAAYLNGERTEKDGVVIYTGAEGKLIVDKTVTIIACRHKPGDPVRENVVEATCTEPGSCDEVIYCSVCHEELSRESRIVPAKGHTPGAPEETNPVPATCTETAHHDKVTHCEVCGALIGTETVIDGEPLGHDYTVSWSWTDYTAATATLVCSRDETHTEILDAGITSVRTEPTCIAEGSVEYTATAALADGTTYTDVRTQVLEKTEHTPGEPVRENVEEATCVDEGCCDKVTYCTFCHAKIRTEHVTIPAMGHEPGSPVEEDRFEPTYDAEGGYDEVIYCVRPGCGAELKREHRSIPRLIKAPVITDQPAGLKATAGKTATFTVTATGTDLKYQWYVQKKGSPAWTEIGGDSPTLTVTAGAELDGAKYRCRVSNEADEVMSDTVTLTVIYKPVITTQPKKVSVKAGKKVTLKVKARGGDLKYQWYCQKPGTKKWVKIKKATKAAYSFKAAKKKSGYKYRCLVKNAAGQVYTKAVKVTVK